MKLFPLAVAALLVVPAYAQPGSAGECKPCAAEHHGPMFQNMSEAGRTQLFAAMRSTPKERAEAKKARDQINSLIAADKLDSAALRRAMDNERKLTDTQRARRQVAMLAAIEKLSEADRKAFAATASRARATVEARTDAWRNRSMQKLR